MEDLDSLLKQYIDVKKGCKTNKFMDIVCLNYEFLFNNIIISKNKLIENLKLIKKNLILYRQTVRERYHKQHLNNEINKIKEIINKENNNIDSIKKILFKYNEKKNIYKKS